VEVSADSLMEAAALALAVMKHEEWVDGTGPSATLEISVVQPVVKHTVPVKGALAPTRDARPHRRRASRIHGKRLGSRLQSP
jgi:hypothetical protein